MKDDNKVLKFMYAVFLGGVVTLFVAFGIETFYQSPQFPEYPDELSYIEAELTPKQEAAQKQYDRAIESYDETQKSYSRNVSIVSLAAAVVLLAVSLIFEKKIRVIADGLMFGGLFLLVYAVGRAAFAGESMYTFIALSVSLVVALALGYLRFVKPEK